MISLINTQLCNVSLFYGQELKGQLQLLVSNDARLGYSSGRFKRIAAIKRVNNRSFPKYNI